MRESSCLIAAVSDCYHCLLKAGSWLLPIMKPANEDKCITELIAHFVTVFLNIFALSPVTSPLLTKKNGAAHLFFGDHLLTKKTCYPNMHEW